MWSLHYWTEKLKVLSLKIWREVGEAELRKSSSGIVHRLGLWVSIVESGYGAASMAVYRLTPSISQGVWIDVGARSTTRMLDD